MEEEKVARHEFKKHFIGIYRRLAAIRPGGRCLQTT
jgi:hypothetical protein